MSVALAELSEPVLLYVCRLRRAARKGGSLSYQEAKREIEQVLADARSKANPVPGLLREWERVEDALIFFVDSMIAECSLPFASEWHSNRLAYERNERAGDDKFYDILDELLADPSEEATRAVGVLYSCMGVGFEGCLAGAPEEHSAKMLECAGRIRQHMEQDQAARVTPEAYEHVDRRDLIEPPGMKIGAIALGFAGFLGVLFIASWVFYSSFTGDLKTALSDIEHPQEAVKRGEAD